MATVRNRTRPVISYDMSGTKRVRIYGIATHRSHGDYWLAVKQTNKGYVVSGISERRRYFTSETLPDDIKSKLAIIAVAGNVKGVGETSEDFPRKYFVTVDTYRE